MTESVEANFTITRDEYVRAMRRYYKNKLQWKRDLVGGIVALGAGIYCLQTSTLLPALAWLLVLAGCFMLTLLMFAIFLLPHMIYRSQPKLKSEYRLQFRDEGSSRSKRQTLSTDLTGQHYGLGAGCLLWD